MAATWEYNSTQEWQRKTYHVWEQPHPWFPTETVYQCTHQPPNGSRVSYFKPTGNGFSTQAYLKRCGIEVVPNNAREVTPEPRVTLVRG